MRTRSREGSAVSSTLISLEQVEAYKRNARCARHPQVLLDVEVQELSTEEFEDPVAYVVTETRCQVCDEIRAEELVKQRLRSMPRRFQPLSSCRECGKMNYHTRKSAKYAIKHGYMDPEMGVYRCGDYFHVGHSWRKLK